jgi:pyruvate dehydrogenase E1 component alpha subunit
MMHTTADDPKRYRTDAEVEKWSKRDPLPRFQKYLMDKGQLSEAELNEVESEVMEEIQAAVDGAEKQMEALGDPIDMFNHAYAEMPPYLKEQKADLARELAAGGEEGKHG